MRPERDERDADDEVSDVRADVDCGGQAARWARGRGVTSVRRRVRCRGSVSATRRRTGDQGSRGIVRVEHEPKPSVEDARGDPERVALEARRREDC